MAYESVKKNNTSWSPAHQPARENTLAPRPYTPQPEQEKEATAQPETYSREAYDLISSRMFPTPNPTVQKQPAPQPQAAELEPEQDEQEQEAESTEKLSTPGNPEPPSNNQSNSSEQQAPIQAKLTIGEPGDQYEQEADNVARQVMSMNVTTPSVQRQNEQPETEIDKKPLSFIQRHSLSRTQTAQQTRTQPTVPRENSPFVQRHLLAKTQTHKIIQKSGKSANPATPSLENQLNSKKGSGSPLDGQTRSFMESRFGTDFSSVRVHTDSTAIQMNKDLGAQAFTHGSDIFYGAGKTPGQNELTAHELTHVVQQGGAKTLNQKVQTKSQPETADINKEVRLFPEPKTIAPKELSETTNYLTNKESHQLHQEIANHHPETPIQTKQLNTQSILQRQPLNISSVSPRIQGNWLAEQAFTKALGSGATQVLSVLKKAGSVFGSIITNPVKFIGNLVTAIRNGFNKFRANIGKHLQNGLAGWLFGALSGAGLVIPAQFDVKGIFSLVLQVLNFTYENVRARLAKKVGGQKVNRLEQSVDVLKKIASGGLVAIWQDIAQYVGNLKDLVIGGIKDWVINTIISQAIAKLISMFTPAGAFIQAVVTIYNTVMFFIERASQIAALANSIFNSIGKIAAGDTGAASNYIEQSMARTLPVMISFLARLIGLGGISQKIKDIIKRIQAPVNKAIDKVVDTIVTKGKAVLSGSNNQTQKSQPTGRVRGNTQIGKIQNPKTTQNQTNKEKPNKIGDFKIESHFSMSGEPHRLISICKKGKLEIFIASDPEKFVPAVIKAEQEVKNSNRFTATQKTEILTLLNEKRQEVTNIEYEFNLNAGEILKGVRRNYEAEKEAKQRYVRGCIAKIAKDFERTAKKYKLKSLEDFYNALPTKRYLPNFEKFRSIGDFIRQKLYYQAGSPSWTTIQNRTMDQEKPGIITKVKQAQQNKDQALWNKLKRQGLVESNANINSYDPAKVEYNVDHIEPLAVRWNEKGHDSSDDVRYHQMSERVNLRVVTGEYNKSKGSGGINYHDYVGVNFTSRLAPQGSLKIDGKPFNDASGRPLV